MRNLEGQADRVMDETDDVSGALCLCVCVYMKKKVKGRQRNSCSFGYTYGTMIYLYLRNNGDNDLFRNSCSFGYTERYWSDTLTEQWYIYTYGTMIYLLPLGTLRGTGATRPLTCPGSRTQRAVLLGFQQRSCWRRSWDLTCSWEPFLLPQTLCILPYPCAYPSCRDTAR